MTRRQTNCRVFFRSSPISFRPMLDSEPQSEPLSRISPHPPAQSRGPSAVGLLAALVLAGLTGAATFVGVIQPGHQADRIKIDVPEIPALPVPEPASATVRRAVLFDEAVQPQIARADQLNRQAAKRCVARLDRVLRGYQRGVNPFVSDLTSISTRLGIVRRVPGNWWNEDQRIEKYVREKFEHHLFSEQALVTDIGDVLEQFKSEVESNQRRMLASVRVAVTESELPEVDVDQYDDFFQSVVVQLNDFATARGTESVYSGLTVLVISEAGSFAATSIVAGLLARFGTAAVVSAAAGAGATAGAAGVGAGGGTLAGPVGTAVGFGVGLAVGLVIDWWMTEKFEAEMSTQMNGYISSLRQTILHGRPTGSPYRPNSPGGIADAMPGVCDRLLDAYRESFYNKIVIPEAIQ